MIFCQIWKFLVLGYENIVEILDKCLFESIQNHSFGFILGAILVHDIHLWIQVPPSPGDPHVKLVVVGYILLFLSASTSVTIKYFFISLFIEWWW